MLQIDNHLSNMEIRPFKNLGHCENQSIEFFLDIWEFAFTLDEDFIDIWREEQSTDSHHVFWYPIALVFSAIYESKCVLVVVDEFESKFKIFIVYLNGDFSGYLNVYFLQ